MRQGIIPIRNYRRVRRPQPAVAKSCLITQMILSEDLDSFGTKAPIAAINTIKADNMPLRQGKAKRS
jgi:hypothetical protein